MTATDKKLQELTTITSWAASTIMYLVTDPSGTPVDNDMTLEDLFTEIITAVTVKTANGIDIGTGAAVDTDLITVRNDVGTDKLWFDESEDAFAFSTGLRVEAGALGVTNGASFNPSDYIHAHSTSVSTKVAARFSNASTGQTDGLVVGVDTDNNCMIWSEDSNVIKVGLNNAEVCRFTSSVLPFEVTDVNNNQATWIKMTNTSALGSVLTGLAAYNANGYAWFGCSGTGYSVLSGDISDCAFIISDTTLTNGIHLFTQGATAPIIFTTNDTERMRLTNSTLDIKENVDFRSYGSGYRTADNEFLQIDHTGSAGRISITKSGSGTFEPFQILTTDLVRFQIGAGGNSEFLGATANNYIEVIPSMSSLTPTNAENAIIGKTDGTGVAPFDEAGSLVYVARPNSTAGRSSHYFYTDSKKRMTIDEKGEVTINGANATTWALSVENVNAVTSGGIAQFISGSGSGANRDLVSIVNDNAIAHDVCLLAIRNDSTAQTQATVEIESDSRDPVLTTNEFTGGLAIKHGNMSIEMGRYDTSPFLTWIQGRSHATGAAYDLALQPLGGDLSIGHGASPVGLDVKTSNGIFLCGDSVTDTANKAARWGLKSYDIDEEPFLFFYGAAQVATNILYVGGGSSQGNTATDIYFYTGAINTTTGTQAMWIDSNGLIQMPHNASPGTPGSNNAGMYAQDVSAVCELFGIDEGGTAAQLTSHYPVELAEEWGITVDEDDDFPEVAYTKNVYLGVERIKYFRPSTGRWDSVTRELPIEERRNWDDDEAAKVADPNSELQAPRKHPLVKGTRKPWEGVTAVTPMRLFPESPTETLVVKPEPTDDAPKPKPPCEEPVEPPVEPEV